MISGHLEYDSIDPDIFPSPPSTNRKREIFWSGTIAECALKARKDKLAGIILDTYYSNAIVVYALNRSVGEFNKTLNIGDQIYAQHVTLYTDDKYFDSYFFSIQLD